MLKKVRAIETPSGLARLAFRIPIRLYQAHLGWLFGNRFVLLTHTGRKSGLPRQTVLEIVRYDRITGACIVASGWDTRSDWFQNVTADPSIFIQVGNKRSPALSERISPEGAAQELVDYSCRHPMAFRELVRFMGYRIGGTEADIRALGRIVPMFLFKPMPETI